MTAFTIIDAGGVARTVNLSNDTRYPLAMDALPRSMSRRFPARDEEMPQQLDAETALAAMRQLAERVQDPDQRKQLSQGMAELMDGMTTETDNSGEDGGTEYPARPGGFVPSASGKTAPKLPMDAALAMDRKDPTLSGYLDRIRLGGR